MLKENEFDGEKDDEKDEDNNADHDKNTFERKLQRLTRGSVSSWNVNHSPAFKYICEDFPNAG